MKMINRRVCGDSKVIKPTKNRCEPVFTAMFTVGIFRRAKRGNSPCPSMDEWINRMWYMPTVEYYSALKRNEVLRHAYMTQIKLEDILLSEVSQTQKNKHCMTPLI